ncbi:MAG: amidohydrolase family protein [Thermodesulfobacteriota bacterium]|jgi:predicted TIM-barrel fold metal-dependent hydrolase
MAEPYIDVHCHLFNKDILSNWLRIMIALDDLVDYLSEADRSGLISARDVRLNFFNRLKHFLDIGTEKDSIAIYEELRQTYGDQFISIPLMLDVAYISTPEEYREIMEPYLEKVRLTNHLDNLIDNLKSRLGGKDINDDPHTVKLLESMKEFKDTYKSFQDHTKGFEKEMAIPVFDPEKSFQIQMQQLADLKKKYGDKVFPFLSVDPRRPNILETVKQQVGSDKIFLGIKLYPPIGFSPTDPVLMGANNLYAYCQDKGIPITAHCSNGGFATYADKVIVSGHIYDRNTGQVKEVNQETIEFQHHFFSETKEAIEERANTLNNPRIWELVVKKYPGLYLNLAHLGGNSDDWREVILSMMKNENNLYSDLACHSDPVLLQKIQAEIYNNGPSSQAKGRIMYGSDYYILMLFADDLDGYLKSFKTIFAGDFQTISFSNPQKFLFTR